ncbi:MAG: hypothetical protein QXW97_02665 [Candidatus Pacearchaeota archaeon]
MKKKFILILFVIIFSVSNVYSLITVRIDVKPSFNVGETVKFDYIISSDKNQEISYIARIKCPGLFERMLLPENVGISKDVPLSRTYEGFNVTKEIKPQQCIAIVEIQKPINLIRQEVFEIVNEPLINFRLKMCNDEKCNKESKVFIQGEKVYFDYSSDVDNLVLSPKIVFPNYSSKVISIPTSIIFNEIGSYKIEVSAYKSGYRSFELTENFAIIEKKSIIQKIIFRGSEESSSENIDNFEKSKIDSNYLWIFLIIIVIILIIVIFSIFFINFKKQRDINKKENLKYPNNVKISNFEIR